MNSLKFETSHTMLGTAKGEIRVRRVSNQNNHASGNGNEFKKLGQKCPGRESNLRPLSLSRRQCRPLNYPVEH